MPHHTKHSDKKFKLYSIFKISVTKKSEITKTVIAVAELFTNSETSKTNANVSSDLLLELIIRCGFLDCLYLRS